MFQDKLDQTLAMLDALHAQHQDDQLLRQLTNEAIAHITAEVDLTFAKLHAAVRNYDRWLMRMASLRAAYYEWTGEAYTSLSQYTLAPKFPTAPTVFESASDLTVWKIRCAAFRQRQQQLGREIEEADRQVEHHRQSILLLIEPYVWYRVDDRAVGVTQDEDSDDVILHLEAWRDDLPPLADDAPVTLDEVPF